MQFTGWCDFNLVTSEKTVKLPYFNPSQISNHTVGHGNDNGKVNYVADKKVPQQMACHGIPYKWIYW